VVAPKMQARGLKQMRGSRVTWSPNSPADEGMRTRPDAWNPEARKCIHSYSQMIASGKLTNTCTSLEYYNVGYRFSASSYDRLRGVGASCRSTVMYNVMCCAVVFSVLGFIVSKVYNSHSASITCVEKP